MTSGPDCIPGKRPRLVMDFLQAFLSNPPITSSDPGASCGTSVSLCSWQKRSKSRKHRYQTIDRERGGAVEVTRVPEVFEAHDPAIEAHGIVGRYGDPYCSFLLLINSQIGNLFREGVGTHSLLVSLSSKTQAVILAFSKARLVFVHFDQRLIPARPRHVRGILHPQQPSPSSQLRSTPKRREVRLAIRYV